MRMYHAPHEIGKIYYDVPQPGGGLMALTFWGLVIVGLWLKVHGVAALVIWLKGWL